MNIKHTNQKDIATSKLFIFLVVVLLLGVVPAQASAISVNLEGGGERYLFTGKELDKDTGLYYYGARYYKSVFATFTQPDTKIANVYNPQDLNRYAYVRNNPLKYEDPSGKSPTLVTGAIGAVAGGIIGGAISATVQYHNTGSVDLGEVGKAAAVGAVAGGVAGLTLGVGTALAGGLGLTGTGAAVAEAGVAASASVAGGQSARAAENVIAGNEITEGLGDPGDIAVDATIGVATWGLGKGYGRLRTSSLERAIKAGDSSIKAGGRAEAEAMARNFVGKGSEPLMDYRGRPVGWINRETGRTWRFAESHKGGPWHINAEQLAPDPNTAGKWRPGTNVHIEFSE